MDEGVMPPLTAECKLVYVLKSLVYFVLYPDAVLFFVTAVIDETPEGTLIVEIVQTVTVYMLFLYPARAVLLLFRVEIHRAIVCMDVVNAHEIVTPGTELYFPVNVVEGPSAPVVQNHRRRYCGVVVVPVGIDDGAPPGDLYPVAEQHYMAALIEVVNLYDAPVCLFFSCDVDDVPAVGGYDQEFVVEVPLFEVKSLYQFPVPVDRSPFRGYGGRERGNRTQRCEHRDNT